MITVGLTGGIGSGKSEVARLLGAHGAVVMDADALAREAVAPGTRGWPRSSRSSARRSSPPTGPWTGPRLGRLVFADDERLAALEAVVHPYVRRRSAELMAAAAPDAVVVYDVPLLVEKQLQAALRRRGRGRRLDARPVAPADRSPGDDRGGRPGPDGGAGHPRGARWRWPTWSCDNDGDLADLRPQVDGCGRDLRRPGSRGPDEAVGGPTYGDRVRPTTDLERRVAPFQVVSDFQPSGDQPAAIDELERRIRAGETERRAARRHRHRQVGDDRLAGRAAAAADAGDGARTRRWPPSSPTSSASCCPTTRSSTSSPTTTTTSPRRTSRRRTPTSRRTRRSTTRSSGCATRRPTACSPGAT